MTDKQYMALAKKTYQAKNKYYNLLDKLEAEYETRKGISPSDADDDSFIDIFHIKGEDYDTQTMEEILLKQSNEQNN